MKNLKSLSDFEKEVAKYKQFLIDMNKDSGINITNNSDLLNVRDEILGNLNQFTYLFLFIILFEFSFERDETIDENMEIIIFLQKSL